MSLNANIFVPGLIGITYPFSGQTLTSDTRLAGTVFADPAKLPAGLQYLISQLTPEQIPQLTPSYALQGKTYLIQSLTYYIDGTAYRSVDYTNDEIVSYQFSQDYLPNIVTGEPISAGPHRLTVYAQFFSLQNPGISIYDVIDINYTYDPTSISLRGYLDKMAPQPFLSAPDHQLIMEMLDWIMTQRTEGAIKRDIDAIGTFYDLKNIPDFLLPYLSNSLGYQYFAGLLGTSTGSIKQELAFLPEWQKTAGTLQSMLTLLRAFNLNLTVVPLYLDLVNNYLLPGAQTRFRYTDQEVIPVNTKATRLAFPFTHPDAFDPTTVTINVLANETPVMTIMWDKITDAPMVTYFFEPAIGDVGNYWLTPDQYAPNPVPTLFANIQSITVDPVVGGLVIAFNDLVTTVQKLRLTATYQYTKNTRPGRNTRLSEFFDVVINSSGAPNDKQASDYARIVQVITRSKPFTKKLRNLDIPIRYADAYQINTLTSAADGNIADTTILSANNIDRRAVNLSNPITEQVTITPFTRVLDGFTFSWENVCDRWENRFGIFQSLALDPLVYDPVTQAQLMGDTLMQRGYAITVPDDTKLKTFTDFTRWARRLGLQIPNFKGGTTPYTVIPSYVGHYYTLQFPTPTSPQIDWFKNLIIELDDPLAYSPANTLAFQFDLIGTVRSGFVVGWDGTNLTSGDINVGPLTPETWDSVSTDEYVKTWVDPSFLPGTATMTLTLIRFSSVEAVKAFYVAREDTNNTQFEIGTGKWYAVWDMQGDYYTDPIHMSVLFGFVKANFQNDSCCPVLGDVTASSPLTFNEALTGYGYNYQGLSVAIINDQLNQEVARYVWNGGYWEIRSSQSDLTVSLNPATTSLTGTVLLSGIVTYTGPSVDAYTYRVIFCPGRKGDLATYTPQVSLSDEFSNARLRRGQLSIFSKYNTFLGGMYIQDLIDMSHDMNIPTEMAIDGFYLKTQEASPQELALFPGLRMTLMPPPPCWQQFQYNVSFYGFGSSSPEGFYDTAYGSQQYVQILHFPKRLVILTAANFIIESVPFYLIDNDSGNVIQPGDYIWISGQDASFANVNLFFTLFGQSFPPDTNYVIDQSS